MYPLLGLGVLCGFFDRHRQSYYEAKKRQQQQCEVDEQVVAQVKAIRKKLPGIGTRKLYSMLQDWLKKENIALGRDKFHALLKEKGLLVKRKKKTVRTTDSLHSFRKYSDLRKDLEVTAANQLWVSDITGSHRLISTQGKVFVT